MIRVLVLADSSMALGGLMAQLGSDPDLEVAGRIVGTGRTDPWLDGAGGAGGAGVDVVVVALGGDPEDSESILRALTGMQGAAPVVALSEDPSVEWSRAALGAGARAVLPVTSRPDEMRAAIAAVSAGFVVTRPERRRARARASAGREWSSAATASALSARELQVLGLVADGLGNKAIAGRLGVTERTVKFHLASVFQKLDVDSRTEAVTAALRRGLIML